jgi:CubicO group peptidase (beta-lactamase class C family)
MSKIVVDVDPAEVGMDAKRLERVSSHFQRYVDDGRLPGFSVLVSRGNKVVFADARGMADIASNHPMELDTIVRIYSMTKPITSVAAMILFERGLFELTDPVYKFIPSFKDVKVFQRGSSQSPALVPAQEPMRIWHLLTHTAGLTYGFHYAHPVDQMYRSAGFEWGAPEGFDLAQCCDAWAGLPLLFEPGSEWNYSVATDVLGRVVEVVAGKSLEEFFQEEILVPLGMSDTGFFVNSGDRDRVASLYTKSPYDGALLRIGSMAEVPTETPRYLSGGGGLLSTLRDYHRFTQMLLNRGELDGFRVLGSRSVDYMTMNHLPGDQDLETFGRPIFAESSYKGVGFGLGFAVVRDVAASKTFASMGEYSWGGAASTAFWVDPKEGLTVVFLTQLIPSSTYPIRTQLAQLVYQSLVD